MSPVGLAVAVLTVVFTLTAIFFLDGAESQVSVCVTPEQRDHIRGVMLEAIDKALDDQVGNLFGNWVKDQAGQPKRAQTGMNNTIKAFVIARANTLAWDPAECTATFQLQSAEAAPWR